MSSNNIMIKYHGFKLNDLTKQYVQSLFSNVVDAAPRTAKIDITFTKKDDLVKGMIHIHSADGSFFSSAVDNNIKIISEKLSFQVLRRLERWKSKHHERQSLRHFEFNQTA